MSVNMELPSQKSLALLAPDKSKQHILAPMRQIKENIAEDKDTRALMRKETTYMTQVRPKKKERAFVPAGQSTQMIIGATPESDFQILNLSAALYRSLSLKRVFFSAYLPVNADARLPAADAVQLNREHRLVPGRLASALLPVRRDGDHRRGTPVPRPRAGPEGELGPEPPGLLPVEVNKAPFDALLRVPGIGVRGAKLIVKARRGRALGRAGAAQAGHRLQAGTLLHHVRRGATRAKARTSRARTARAAGRARQGRASWPARRQGRPGPAEPVRQRGDTREGAHRRCRHAECGRSAVSGPPRKCEHGAIRRRRLPKASTAARMPTPTWGLGRGRADERAAGADGAYGWQHALEPGSALAAAHAQAPQA